MLYENMPITSLKEKELYKVSTPIFYDRDDRDVEKKKKETKQRLELKKLERQERLKVKSGAVSGSDSKKVNKIKID